jgi:hypothetical protein
MRVVHSKCQKCLMSTFRGRRFCRAAARREFRPAPLITIRAISPDGPDVFAVQDIGFRGFAIVTAEPVVVRTRSSLRIFELSHRGVRR